jgi:hypothetical protein
MSESTDRPNGATLFLSVTSTLDVSALQRTRFGSEIPYCVTISMNLQGRYSAATAHHVLVMGTSSLAWRTTRLS